MIALVALLGTALASILCLARVVVGPTQHDRALALRSCMIKLALAAAALGVLLERPQYLDVAVALTLSTLVVLVAFVRVFRLRNMQAPLAMVEET